MAGVHDFTCYLKRGFGRATWQASVDVRNGLLTREEGFELVKKHDQERPGALDYYIHITGMTEEDFFRFIGEKRLNQLKDIEIPVRKKERENAEKTIPFVQQIIAKHLGKPDPRIARELQGKDE